MNEQIQLNDEVWHRVVVIVQEAILLGVDCTDLLRQVRVCPGPDGTLVLSQEYKKMINEQHQKLLEEAVAKQAELSSQRIVK